MSEFSPIDAKDGNLVGQLLVFLTNEMKRLNKTQIEQEKQLKGAVTPEHMKEYEERVKRLEEFAEQLKENAIAEAAVQGAIEKHLADQLTERDRLHKEAMDDLEAKTKRSDRIKSIIGIVAVIVGILATIYMMTSNKPNKVKEPTHQFYPIK